MTLYYKMCRGWQNCCRRGKNQSWPSVSFESVDSECWFLNNAIFYAFIMWLTAEKHVFISDSYLKTTSYALYRQSFVEKFRRQSARPKAVEDAVFMVGPAGPTTNTARLSPRYKGKTRGCHCSHRAPDDGRENGRENARNMLSYIQTSG
jgi:hypothetical protein